MREKTGLSEETIQVPGDVLTVADLKDWMRSRGPEFAEAFAAPKAVRAALNQTHAKDDAMLGDVREVAFFPPVTGG